RGAVAVAGLVEVVVEAGGAVRVDIAEHGQLSGAGQVGRAGAVAEGQQGGRLALVADDRGRRRADGHGRAAAEYLYERKGQVVGARELELVAVELRVGGHDREPVTARERVGVRVLGEVALRPDKRAGVALRRPAAVDPEVG